jgi:hypothetical protein
MKNRAFKISHSFTNNSYLISLRCLLAMAYRWKYMVNIIIHGKKKETMDEVIE